MIIACAGCGAKNRLPTDRLNEAAHCARCKTGLSPLHAPLALTSEQEFDELVSKSPLPVVVDFWAEWCGPCRMVAPELEKVASKKAGHVIVAKVNTDQLQGLAQRFGISGIPTLVKFDGGRERARFSGARPASGIIAELGL